MLTTAYFFNTTEERFGDRHPPSKTPLSLPKVDVLEQPQVACRSFSSAGVLDRFVVDLLYNKLHITNHNKSNQWSLSITPN